MVADLMSFYKGDQPGHTPGLLPDPYYCMSLLGPFLVTRSPSVSLLILLVGWEAGAMMGTLIGTYTHCIWSSTPVLT